MHEFLRKLQNILSEFLGSPKNDVTANGQIQFNCPCCIEEKGEREKGKFNLEVNIVKNVYRCWSCGEYNDNMHGSIKKLFRIYANEKLWNDYISIINDFRKSKLYQIHFKNDELKLTDFVFLKEEVSLPNIYRPFKENGYNPKAALEYLTNRGIGWDIINKYHIGYTLFDSKQKELSTRIIIPSYDEFNDLNYWTGREYSGFKGKQKYYNPKVERKEIIFNEHLIQWDADINLCEGPMDAIVLPNSIPLLGKALKPEFKIYDCLMKYANANINIFLDGDAYNDVKKIYKLLNQGRLKNRIKYIPVSSELDPSEIYEKFGKKGIIEHLKNAKNIEEIELNC